MSVVINCQYLSLYLSISIYLFSLQVTVSGKADRLVAERALRQRSHAKLEHRRSTYKDSLDSVVDEQRTALMKKHNVSNKVVLGGTG